MPSPKTALSALLLAALMFSPLSTQAASLNELSIFRTLVATLERYVAQLAGGTQLAAVGALSSDPVGYWTLDEGSGTSAKDGSSTKANGTLAGDAAWTSGRSGTGLAFAGSGGVAIPGSSYNWKRSPFTISLSFKTTGSGVLVSQTGESDHVALSVLSSGKVKFEGNPGSSIIPLELTSPGSYNDGAWHHVVAVRDGERTGALYVDGMLVASDTDASGSGRDIDLSGTLYLGRTSSGDGFTGSIDSVALYKRAVSASEAATLSGAGGTPTTPDPTPPTPTEPTTPPEPTTPTTPVPPVTPSTYTITAGVSGSGTVKGKDIYCTDNTGTCSMTVKPGTKVKFTKKTPSGYRFKGWTGACESTSSSCTVTVNADTQVIGLFESRDGTPTTPTPSTYTARVTIAGSGSVSGGGISCTNGSGTCSVSGVSGSKITLQATPASGYTFSKWGGACNGSSSSCSVTLSSDKSVTATFEEDSTTPPPTDPVDPVPPTPPVSGNGITYYVNPSGNDSAAGTSSGAPLKSIQKALDKVKAGDTIVLAPGIYRGNLQTKTAGTAAAPITIKGTDVAKDPAKRLKTVVYGTSHVFNIDHSYYTLYGFAVDGQEALENAYKKDFPGSDGYPDAGALASDPTRMTVFKDKYQSYVKDGRAIYIGTTGTNITGTVLDNMFVQGGGGECIRFRNTASNSRIVNSVVRYCGLFAKPSDDRYAYHNGEAVYIGTSPKSTSQPQAGKDYSNNIVVDNSILHPFGSECFNTKEQSHSNVMRNSDCRYNLEPAGSDGSNVELRGDHNSLLNNIIDWSLGWNLKFRSDSSKYDLGGNTAKYNLLDRAYSGIAVLVEQKSTVFCGNVMTGSADGVSSASVTAACK